MWRFERVGPMGGATGGAYRNALDATGITREARLAREAIQNSCDASADSDDAVKVVFRKIELVGESKSNFATAFLLRDAFLSRIDSLRLSETATLKLVQDANIPLSLLLVEDFNTTGLSGNPDSPESSYFRLVLSLGNENKAYGQSHTGGSYGFGKSVFGSLSDSETFFVYSTVDPSQNDASSRALFVGAGFFTAHLWDQKHWTGRAWFGNGVEEEVNPFVDDVADNFASEIGFRPRSHREYGTGIAILGFDADMNALRDGIEDYWWPRLAEQDLTVELWDGNEKLEPPRPRRRPDLRPFVECYDLALGKATPDPKRELAQDFNRYKQPSTGELLRLGMLGARSFEPRELVDSDRTENRLNTVALIREPRMVVQYLPVRPRSVTAYVGVFIANDDVEDYLRMSEPPAHDRWAVDASRLVDRYGAEGTGIVKTILDRIRQGVGRWLGQLEPAAVQPNSRISSIDKIFGQFLSSLGQGAPPRPPASPDPIQIDIGPVTPLRRDGIIELCFSPKISLRTGAGKQRIMVTPGCFYLMDADHRKGDRVVTYIRKTGDLEWSTPGVTVALIPEEPIAFDVRSEPFDDRCAVDYELKVVPAL